MTYQNLWNRAKAILRGKFIVMSAYIKRTERSELNYLMLHLKLLEKQDQAKLKSNRRRQITKIRAKINEIENKKTIQIINETKSWFTEKTNKIDKPLTNLTKMRKEKTQIRKIRNTEGEITTKSRESSETSLRTYIPINLKILKKWAKFWILMIIQN
jgi:hypothetical protein